MALAGERTPGRVAGTVHTPDSLGPHLVLDELSCEHLTQERAYPLKAGSATPAKILILGVVGSSRYT